MSYRSSYKKHRSSAVATATADQSTQQSAEITVAEQQLTLQVAVVGPFYSALDYLIPDQLQQDDLLSPTNTDQSSADNDFKNHTLQPGMRVEVPLGRRVVVGIVISQGKPTYVARQKLRPIIRILDTKPVISQPLLQLAKWASHYYQYPLGELTLSLLPRELRLGKPIREAASSPSAQKCSSKTSRKALSAAPVKPSTASVLAAAPLTPNTQQQLAIDAIQAMQNFQVALLWGITGSGKTEVYLQSMTPILAAKKQVLVLVPEISLTPQTVQRFVDRFVLPVYVVHSRLTPKVRAEVWAKIESASACIVIGTRSALFSPLSQLGLIIIDEEHDASFKQQSQWRYHARDTAIMRANIEQVPLVLGSATPSLESIKNAKSGRYMLLKLDKRAGKSRLADWSIVDMRQQKSTHGLSESLQQRIQTHLDRGNQVLIFLNRRGYAPLLRCFHCGWCARCDHCDCSMTLHHHSSQLLCHYCEAKRAVPNICPDCQQAEPGCVGIGTEQLQQHLQALFPDQVVLRIDRDTTRRKGELDAHLQQARQGKARILLGTQMLAKGHHFPQLSLVGILDVDSALHSIDFRGCEQFGQLLTQVAGRSGREKKAGEVVIQTHCPEHPALQLLLQQDYSAYADKLLAERQLHALPPYCYFVLVRAHAKTAAAATAALTTAKTLLQKKLKMLQHSSSLESNNGYQTIRIQGPIPAPIERLGDRYRTQLLLQSHSRPHLQKLLTGLGAALSQQRILRQVTWSIDVDPQDMY